MNEKQHDKSGEPQKKKNPFFEFFPREYDFEIDAYPPGRNDRIRCKAFVDWLETHPLSDPYELQRIETEVDIMRHDLEEKLIQVFFHPV